MIRYKVKGLDVVLRKLSAGVKDRVIRTSLNQAALELIGWIRSKRLSGYGGSSKGRNLSDVLRVQTGRLRASIHMTPTEKSGIGYRTKIGTNVWYGRIHELGLKGMKKRAFLQPALEDRGNRRMVLNRLTKNIERAIARQK